MAPTYGYVPAGFYDWIASEPCTREINYISSPMIWMARKSYSLLVMVPKDLASLCMFSFLPRWDRVRATTACLLPPVPTASVISRRNWTVHLSFWKSNIGHGFETDRETKKRMRLLPKDQHFFWGGGKGGVWAWLSGKYGIMPTQTINHIMQHKCEDITYLQESLVHCV